MQGACKRILTNALAVTIEGDGVLFFPILAYGLHPSGHGHGVIQHGERATALAFSWGAVRHLIGVPHHRAAPKLLCLAVADRAPQIVPIGQDGFGRKHGQPSCHFFTVFAKRVFVRDELRDAIDPRLQAIAGNLGGIDKKLRQLRFHGVKHLEILGLARITPRRDFVRASLAQNGASNLPPATYKRVVPRQRGHSLILHFVEILRWGHGARLRPSTRTTNTHRQ